MTDITLAVPAVLVASLALCGPAWAGIEITPETTFHRAVNSPINEGGSVDPGGLLFFFVRNNSDTPDRVVRCTVNGTDVTALPGFNWWRVWPGDMAAAAHGNNVSAVTVKVRDAVISEGETITIMVETEGGASATQEYTCLTPTLRLAEVMPSPDMRTVNIYVRNDDTVPYELTELLVNEERYVVGVDPGLSVVGGDPTVAPGQLAVLQVTHAAPLPRLHPLALRVLGHRDGVDPVWVGAPTRLLEAFFAFGTWAGNLVRYDEGMAFARMLGLNLRVPGAVYDTGEEDPLSPGDTMRAPDVNTTRQMVDRFHIREFPYVRRPHPDRIAEASGDPTVGAWYIRDEPDLFGDDSGVLAAHNQRVWDNDPHAPTWMNMVSTRKYSEMGAITDIIGCTNYPMFSAPSHIAGTWIWRRNEMSQAYEWNRLMKANTEPQRAWNWGQLCGGVWGTQPEPWGIDYMFWSYIMGGSKGIIWFNYNAEDEHDEQFSAQIQRARYLMGQFNPVRSLVLYGQPIDNIEAPDSVIARTLVSPEAALVVLVNNNISMGGFPWSTTYNQSPVSGDITVTLPDWIPTSEILRGTASGATPVQGATVAGNDVTLPFHIEGESLVWIIGEADNTPPEAPDRLTFASFPDGGFTLSWREPYDNRGVAGYKIYRNGTEVADTPWPVHTFPDPPDRDDVHEVRAYDSAGNTGPASNSARYLAWSFESDAYLEGWTVANVAHAEVTGGVLELGATDGTGLAMTWPWRFARTGFYVNEAIAPLRFDGDRHNYFRVRMANPTNRTAMRVAFATETFGNIEHSNNRVHIPVEPNTPGMRTYWIDMSEAAHWGGTVVDVQVSLPDRDTAGTVGIDAMHFTYGVTVPELPGLSEQDAMAAVNAAGLVPGEVTYEYSLTVPEGQVIVQSIAGGTEVAEGVPLDMVISAGSHVPVPDVVGLSRVEAEASITAAGLTLGEVAERHNDSAPEGDVIDQEPPPGTEALLESHVDLVISLGPAKQMSAAGPLTIMTLAALSSFCGLTAIRGATTT